jgi:hypothetical protein
MDNHKCSTIVLGRQEYCCQVLVTKAAEYTGVED